MEVLVLVPRIITLVRIVKLKLEVLEGAEAELTEPARIVEGTVQILAKEVHSRQTPAVLPTLRGRVQVLHMKVMPVAMESIVLQVLQNVVTTKKVIWTSGMVLTGSLNITRFAGAKFPGIHRILPSGETPGGSVLYILFEPAKSTKNPGLKPGEFSAY